MASINNKGKKSQWIGIDFGPRGGDIHQAAFRGNLPALRHWIRVAPASVHEKESLYGRVSSDFFFWVSGMVGGRWQRWYPRFLSLVLKEIYLD